MEPAVERREHISPQSDKQTEYKLPQWSPPLHGGSTPTHTFTDVTNIVPQWSPPLNGGSTPMASHGSGGLARRNGARRRTAGAPHPHMGSGPILWVPQWSPPSDGGSTSS